MSQQIARLFMNGRSQAVRLPAAFRFDTDEVYIRRDDTTGEIILSAKPSNWDGFFAALERTRVPENFLSEQERAQDATQRDPFANRQE